MNNYSAFEEAMYVITRGLPKSKLITRMKYLNVDCFVKKPKYLYSKDFVPDMDEMPDWIKRPI